MFIIKNQKLPKGAHIKLLFCGTEYEGICRGIEKDSDNGYSGYNGYNILQFTDGNEGHGALNEDGEKFEHCWWIEHNSEIVECTSPTPSANISELF